MRKTVIIKATEDTPDVKLLKKEGEIYFIGKSYPEDASEFYKPVKDWVFEYIKDACDETIITFNFDYLNTASTKYILQILLLLGELVKLDKSIQIIWYFRKEDEDMETIGKKFAMLTKLPFTIKSY